MFFSIKKRKVEAFTLIELLISIGIITMMSMIMFYKYPDSAVRVNLANTTYKLAYFIKEAQLRGSSVDSSSGTIGGYGVYLYNNNKDRAVMWADNVDSSIVTYSGIGIGNSLYDIGTEASTTMLFGTNFYISNICVTISGTNGTISCSNDVNGNVNPSALFSIIRIVFVRPNPQAMIYINGNTSNPEDNACIELSTKDNWLPGHKRSVHVFNSGVVYTSSAPCSTN